VKAGRDTETLTDDQSVPSQALGGSAQWSRPVGRMQTLVAGFEGREVNGESNDVLPGVSATIAGGRERTMRVFGETFFSLVLGSLRTYRSATITGATSERGSSRSIPRHDADALSDRISDALNPRASLLYRLGHSTSLTASGYRAFRAPTLNELYRNFYQGNILTYGNPALVAERLTGVEAGVRQGFFPTGSICVRRSFGTTSPMAS